MDATTPKQLGYRWPAEWEPHAATWLAWPHNRATWPGRIEHAIREFVRFAEVLAEFELVHVLAGCPKDSDVLPDARRFLGKLKNVRLHPFPTNDCWVRDYGPICLQHATGEPALIDWQYNAWGNKYPPFDDDNRVPSRIAVMRGRRRFAPDMVLEGGSVETDGRGTLLTTTNCLLNPNRNPGKSKSVVESYLTDCFGAEQIVWLNGELAGDDTDGHIDQLARFVSPHVVVYVVEANRDDRNYLPLRSLEQQLQQKLPGNEDIDLVSLPLPSPVITNGQRLPASYANFYIANGVVLVPAFEDSADEKARDILDELFAERQVISLPARSLVYGLGAFHCMTQQEPAG